MEYPRPIFRRTRWISLNGEWEYGAGDTQRFDRRITVPFCPQSVLSGLRDLDPGDTVWYRRRFDAPTDRALMLHFGAVDYWAAVWVNGEEVARHEGRHTPFSADISAIVRPTDNELVVRADDPLADKTISRGKQHWTTNPERIFYTASTGIWQTVWLEPLPARRIHGLRVTPDLDHCSIEFDLDADDRVELIATFEGEEVGRWQGDPGHGHMALNAVHAWNPETPHLYGLRLRLGGIDEIDEIDEVESHFGLRKVETLDGQFRLNNERYVQRLVLDQGYFPGGLMTAPTGSHLKRDIELAKAMGFNGARKHQKVEDPRWLYWADVLGFLAWAEMPSFREDSPAARQRHASEWVQAVRLQRNHPSVVVWVPMNESDGLGPNPASFLDHLYRLTKDADPERPVVSNDGWQQATTDLCTLHDYNPAPALARRYRDIESALDPTARARPPYLPGYAYGGEPVILSEIGGVALAGAGGWNYAQAGGPKELLETYRELVEAVMSPGPVQGFCYTQLTDIEQERNGLLTFERRPKVDPALLRPITQLPKR